MDPSLLQQFRDADLSRSRLRDIGFNSAQRKAIKYFYSKALTITIIQVRRPSEAKLDKDRCVRDTYKQINQLAKTKDKGQVIGEIDARFKDFKQVNPSFS